MVDTHQIALKIIVQLGRCLVLDIFGPYLIGNVSAAGDPMSFAPYLLSQSMRLSRLYPSTQSTLRYAAVPSRLKAWGLLIPYRGL
jgi:hypothetical protein